MSVEKGLDKMEIGKVRIFIIVLKNRFILNSNIIQIMTNLNISINSQMTICIILKHMKKTPINH